MNSETSTLLIWWEVKGYSRMTILLTCLVNTSNLKQVKPSGFSGDHDARASKKHFLRWWWKLIFLNAPRPHTKIKKAFLAFVLSGTQFLVKSQRARLRLYFRMNPSIIPVRYFLRMRHTKWNEKFQLIAHGKTANNSVRSVPHFQNTQHKIQDTKSITRAKTEMETTCGYIPRGVLLKRKKNEEILSIAKQNRFPPSIF